MMNIIRTIRDRQVEIIVLLALVFPLVFPNYALAVEPLIAQKSIMVPTLVIKAEKSDDIALVSPIKEVTVIKTYQIPVTSYSSTVDQCDSTPCITANGFDLCAHNQEDVIAANFLPFGTKVRMPEIFGDRIFTVQDRMNARYYYRADVWMRTREAAQKFGLVYTKLEVIE